MSSEQNITRMLRSALGAAAAVAVVAVGTVHAQVPADIEAGLKKIGQIVDPACTAKLYRPLMPAKDYNTYWPTGCAGPGRQRGALSGRHDRARSVVRAEREGPRRHLRRRQGRREPHGADLCAGRRRQQDRAAGPRSQRVLRQHRPLGDEERHGRRHRAASSRDELGRRRPRHFAGRRLGSRQHRASTTAIRTASSSGRSRPATARPASTSGIPSGGRTA